MTTDVVIAGPHPVRIALLLCCIEIAGMLGFALAPALLPTFIADWSLTNTQGGILAGALLGGYMCTVPVLVSLTDRVDARRIYVASATATALALAAFALVTDGFVLAVVFQFLAGAGLGGTYMPGLKLLSDRIGGPRQSRYISFYTSSFSIGAALSYFAGGAIGAELGWRWAAGLGAAGAFVAGLGVALCIRDGASRPDPAAPRARLFDFRPVLRARVTMSYVLGYTAHMFELFALRSWLVAFLVFAQPGAATVATYASATLLAAIVNLIGLPASVAGNELAMRLGRRRVLLAIMILSSLAACGIGFASTLSFGLAATLMALYGVLVAGDSAGLTAGAIANAPDGRRGATMAVHSTLGFAAGVLGSIAIGAVLDAAGGMSVAGWGAAFATVGAATALGPIALYFLGRGQPDKAA